MRAIYVKPCRSHDKKQPMRDKTHAPKNQSEHNTPTRESHDRTRLWPNYKIKDIRAMNMNH